MDEEHARQRLMALRDELDSALDTAQSATKPVDLELSIGRLSRIDAIQQQERAKKRLADMKRRLALVQQALSRMDKGLWAECALCGEQISEARLEARPEAPLCMPCQEESERG